MVKLENLMRELPDPACRQYLLRAYAAILGKDIDISRPSTKLIAMLKALANPLRLWILCLLAQVEMPVCLLTHVLKQEQSLISHHLLGSV